MNKRITTILKEAIKQIALAPGLPNEEEDEFRYKRKRTQPVKFQPLNLNSKRQIKPAPKIKIIRKTEFKLSKNRAAVKNVYLLSQINKHDGFGYIIDTKKDFFIKTNKSLLMLEAINNQ